MTSSNRYRRVLLKISGESLSDGSSHGLNADALHHLATQIIDAAASGAALAVVVGGGNIVRGATLAKAKLIPQASADYMGMLGTIINGIALKETLDRLGQPARLMSAINITAVAEPFIRGRALRHMEKGRVVILGGGTGNPFCTTDTAAALRAIELDCEIVLKATKVDGVYSADPTTNPDAKRFEKLTFAQAIERKLAVMDLTALSMCMQQQLPIIVFNFKTPGNIRAVIEQKPIGTMISN